MAPGKLQDCQEAVERPEELHTESAHEGLKEEDVQASSIQDSDLNDVVNSERDGSQSHPVVEAVKALQTAVAHFSTVPELHPQAKANGTVHHITEVINALHLLRVKCSEGEENALIAGKNGGVEATISAYKVVNSEGALASGAALEALVSLLVVGLCIHIVLKGTSQCQIDSVCWHFVNLNFIMHGENVPSVLFILQMFLNKGLFSNAMMEVIVRYSGVPADDHNKESFQRSDGPRLVLEALEDEGKVAAFGAAAVAAAATKNEKLKEMFMDLGADGRLIQLVQKHARDDQVLNVACEAIKSLVTADDERRTESKAFKYAMKIAKGGAINSILAAFRRQPKSSPLLPTLCMTLKSLAVNDEICTAFAAQGGLDIIVQFFEYAILHRNRGMAKSACSLLRQLAGSDTNKVAIADMGGLIQIITLMSKFPEDRAVLQESFVALAALTLRSPQNAKKAVEAGVVQIAATVMEKHPTAGPMQRQACQMLRNLAVRNPENRPLIVAHGLPGLIQKAKALHPKACTDVAFAALRDLGFDDYLDM